MEKGFILPSGVYVQAIDTSERIDDMGDVVKSEITAKDYPAGTVEVPLRPSGLHEWDGAAWVEKIPPKVPAQLSPRRFEWLLAYTGLGDVWDAMQAAVKDTDRATYAALVSARKAANFRVEETLRAVAQFRPLAAQVAPNVDLSDAAILAAWDLAENVNLGISYG